MNAHKCSASVNYSSGSDEVTVEGVVAMRGERGPFEHEPSLSISIWNANLRLIPAFLSFRLGFIASEGVKYPAYYY